MRGPMRRVLLPLAASLVAACATAPDPLYDAFREPPMTARPFVRWWWSGSRVNEEEILRELDVMRAAGIGGVEINTIAMEPAVDPARFAAFPEQEWLGPGWTRMVKAAADGARARGMTADLLVGSGWPFGGRFLSPDEQIRRVRLRRKAVEGPTALDLPIAELEKELSRPAEGGGRREGGDGEPTARRLLFARLVPRARAAFEPGRDLLGAGTGDRIGAQVPEGAHDLYLGWEEIGFSHVKLGAPGADGPVVDHLDAKAVRKYLDRLATGLGPALGGKLGDGIRATFIDSLELDRANWTRDLPIEFERRRGYALAPYLPFVLDDADARAEGPFGETVRRARHDFLATIVELFEERFLRTYVAWCRDNGVLSRIQAYGREGHPLEASLLVDLPEGETWLWNDRTRKERIRVESTVINRYVASAARLSGKTLLSFEAMTNAVPVFRETLEDFKIGLDLTVLAGLNHPIVHGFNYTPREAGFPGWVRFGSYLNEQNPWWPHFRKWSDYAARLSAILRQGTPPAQVALLAPRADELSRHGLLYYPFPETAVPTWGHAMAEAMNQVGSTADYVSAGLLAKSTVDGARLAVGPRRYELLVLQDVDALEPEAAAAVARFARAGGKVAFVGRAPSRAPGLHERDANDRKVREAIAAAQAAGGARVAEVPAPTADGLLPWTAGLLRQFQVEPRVALSPQHPALSQLHTKIAGRDFVFFSNTSRTETVAFEAQLPFGGRVFRWDPETGARAPYPHVVRPGAIAARLGPVESLLVTHGEGEAPAAAPPAAEPGAVLAPVAGPWNVELRHVDPKRAASVTLPALVDFSKASDDPRLATFAGVAIYRTSFDAQAEPGARLDLGELHGISEVTLNGTPLGVRWYGRHVYDVGGALRPGRNALEVKVTTMLGNYMRSLKDENDMARRWARAFLPIPMGLVGPVALRAGR